MKNLVLYNGFLKIFERRHRGQSYEVMDRGNAVNVLIVRPGLTAETDQFYFGVQYRAGANQEMQTCAAGMVDMGEKPEQAARREAMEEAGATGKLVHVGGGFTSAGGTTEYMDQYVMILDQLHTPTDLSEGIEWGWLDYEFVKELIFNKGHFSSMQTTNVVQSYLLNRDNILNSEGV